MGDTVKVTIEVNKEFIDQLDEVSKKHGLENLTHDQILGYLVQLRLGSYQDALETWENYLVNMELKEQVQFIADEYDLPFGEVVLMCVKYAMLDWLGEDVED